MADEGAFKFIQCVCLHWIIRLSLLKAYAEAVPYPFANIIGQEIFEARLVPSDTDFKIFRDFGNISGQ